MIFFTLKTQSGKISSTREFFHLKTGFKLNNYRFRCCKCCETVFFHFDPFFLFCTMFRIIVPHTGRAILRSGRIKLKRGPEQNLRGKQTPVANRSKPGRQANTGRKSLVTQGRSKLKKYCVLCCEWCATEFFHFEILFFF